MCHMPDRIFPNTSARLPANRSSPKSFIVVEQVLDARFPFTSIAPLVLRPVREYARTACGRIGRTRADR
jgi:hypothetical protein